MLWRLYTLERSGDGWEELPTVQSVAARFASLDATDFATGDNHAARVATFFQWFEEAKEQAFSAGLPIYDEMNINPRVMFLPDHDEFSYGFLWCHASSKATVILSPHSLPWLENMG
ncbi:hypothetical protein [Sphingobium yanoikuyae]|uniref:hypothetical protein n=1 Tax=Sphingobium yanoikuyae TaxID=13690 RepID=UPI000F7DC91D|nr:hypothetical protein [Sphingobium yanoikuyae]